MNKKEEILKVALSEFAKNGYENTSLEEIAKKCNITKPAIYYHFKSKSELYSKIFIDRFSMFNLKVSGDLEKDIKNYIDEIYKVLNGEFSRIFIREISDEMKNINEEAFNLAKKTIETLSIILKETKINPFFIQTLIVSSFSTYFNTCNLREKISKSIKINPEFEIKKEITSLILDYIKGKK